MNPITANIKRLIEEKGLKQYCVASCCGFSAKNFNYLLNGKKVLRAEHLIPIAKALNVDVNTLCGVNSPDTASNPT